MLKNLSAVGAGSVRSKDDWISRLGESNFDSFCLLQVLTPLRSEAVDGHCGIFNFGMGLQEYEIRVDESVRAYPIVGGAVVHLTSCEGLFFVADPTKFFFSISETNGFTLEDGNQIPDKCVAIAKREIGGKLFKLIFVTNDSWITSFGAAESINRIANGCEGLILFMEIPPKAFPWSVEGKLHLRTAAFPTSDQQWKFPREWICHPRFGIATEQIAEFYQDKKIVFDAVTGRIFIFGKEIVLQKKSRPYHFIRGQLLRGTSAMAADAFSKAFLGEDGSQQDPKVVFQQAKTQAGNAIKKAISNESELEQVFMMLDPGVQPGYRGMVHSNLTENDFIFLGPL